MLETGAHALGCTVFPGGTGQTEQQVQAMAELAPDGYVGTPSFLKIILEKADEMGVAAAEPQEGAGVGRSVPAERARRARRARHRRLPGLRERGSRHRSPTKPTARDGLVVDEGVLVEIVRPGTGDPVAPGEVGEVVVTHALQHRLSADPLRHRRPVGVAAGRESLRPHQRADQGLDGPRRPDDQGQRHVRPPVAGRGHRQAPSRNRARRGSSSTIRTATTG